MTSIYDLSGAWQCRIERNGETLTYPMTLPGTLDENGIGFPDDGGKPWHPDADIASDMAEGNCIATRLTRRYTYEGAARISRELSVNFPQDMRIFLDAERSRHLTLEVNGKNVPCTGISSVSTPYAFELTGLLTGRDSITLISDNSYPGWPHDAIVYSSAATDETQTNWNGVLGYIRLRTEKQVFVSDLRVYPCDDGLRVRVTVNAAHAWSGKLTLSSRALCETYTVDVNVSAGESEIVAESLALREDVRRWDIDEGNLYSMTASLSNGSDKTAEFGVRSFRGNESGKLALNGRVIFIRGEANCAEFPETGHPPTEVEEWTRILGIYRSYGVNCMRFHSHIPPIAAFTAADRLGMLMQPELSHWNPKNAFEDEASRRYYRDELVGVLDMLANHPSFVMLTYGNELASGEVGHRYMDELTALAHELDGTRLYANASNCEYGATGCDAASDFYASQSFFGHMLRATSAGMKGHLNECYPSASRNYEASVAELRKTYKKPVFTFEVGQYEVLPDFDELADFKGVTIPTNYELIKKRVCQRGLDDVWKRYVEATGELSLLCYREETEAALRTESLSGISLLGLQDFPGQGTALVGMLNSHLSPKPFDFAKPSRFEAFFRDVLPLVLLEKYTYEEGETLSAVVKLANYGKRELTGRARYTLDGGEFHVEDCLDEICAPAGGVSELGTIKIPLMGISRAERLTLTIFFDDASNKYSIWAYPKCRPICPEGVHECRSLDAEARTILSAGGTVYLSPPSTKEALPNSISCQFSTDFWSVGTFPFQGGGMGQLIDVEHPVFRDFPTKFYTEQQWWAMASRRAVILPKRFESIITELDSYAYLRHMTQLLECRCNGGRLLLSTLGLQELQCYPECRALQSSIYRYLSSDEFAPKQEISADELCRLVKTCDA